MRVIWIVVGWIALASSTLVSALTVGEVQKLLPSDLAGGFGRSVSVSGEIAVIGAYGDDDNGAVSGSVFVFVRDDNGVWTEEAKLLPADGGEGDGFGFSVATAGDTAAVCALWDDEGVAYGSAYVFVREASGNWTEQAKLRAPGSDEWFCRHNFPFGMISISGDTLVIGAPHAADNGEESGAAYVFERDVHGVWSERAKLLASDGAVGDWFGGSVSVSGNTAVVGTNVDYWAGYPGAAYVFVRDDEGSWSEQAKLTASDGDLHDQFGVSVSVSGDTIVVGSPWDQDNGYDSGSAYVFVRDELGVWSEQAKLLASDGVRFEEFGWSVSVTGSRVVVGATGSRYDETGFWTGSAYVFTRDFDGAWIEQTQLLASGEPVHDYFGSSVSVSGDTVAVGVGDAEAADSAHVFTLAPTLWGDKDKVSVTWDAISTAESYTVYRGFLSTLVDTDFDGLPDLGYGDCMNDLDIDPTDLVFVDPEIPIVEGDGFFYLVGFVGPSGESGLGNTSSGLHREPTSACP